MTREFVHIAAALLMSSLVAARAEDLKPATDAKPVAVTTLDQAKSITPRATSVIVHYTWEMHKADQFTGIMTTLARNPRIRHLTLRIPNSSHVKDEALEVLREFQSLEMLQLDDDRDWEAPSIFEQVAAMKNLQQLKMSFG